MERTLWEKLEGTTDQILNQLGQLVDEGNVRRVVVKQRGRTMAEFPLTAGVLMRVGVEAGDGGGAEGRNV